jgi:DNA-binding transcriptional regulator YdaS (Cro superfamily)
MTLSDYLATNGLTFTEAATALGCSSQYLSRVARGERQASPALTLSIERWSGGVVRRQELRPDVYPGDTAVA